jgi:hypothetical protein
VRLRRIFKPFFSLCPLRLCGLFLLIHCIFIQNWYQLPFTRNVDVHLFLPILPKIIKALVLAVDALRVAYIQSKPPQPLTTEEMHEILIELSSPLTGYLGREKGKDWKSDRFYFLRDLPTTPK